MPCFAQEGENEFHTIFDNGTCCAVHASNIAPVLLGSLAGAALITRVPDRAFTKLFALVMLALLFPTVQSLWQSVRGGDESGSETNGGAPSEPVKSWRSSSASFLERSA